MNNTALIVGGVAVLGGLAYFLYTKNKTLLPSSTTGGSVAPNSPSTPSPGYTVPVPTVKQTMWKDRDGNIFQITSDLQKWGYVIKVNGAVHKKWNQAMTMFLGPDGYVRSADNNGSTFIWKGGQWNYVIKDNKQQADAFLVEFGQPKLFSGFSGLGNAFVLN